MGLNIECPNCHDSIQFDEEEMVAENDVTSFIELDCENCGSRVLYIQTNQILLLEKKNEHLAART